MRTVRRWSAAAALLLSACADAGPSESVPTAEVETQAAARPAAGSSPEATLGKQLFEDANLSEPAGLSCATCHQAQVSFTDPRAGGTTSKGSIKGRVGPRNTPAILYASFIPPLTEGEESFEGGLFLDGRVNTLEEQAAGPFTNPLEMGNPSQAAVMAKVRKASYAPLFAQVYGASVLADDKAGFQALTRAIAAFERTKEMARFTSKFDDYLAGRAQLSAAEARGLALFNGKANCAACHPSTQDPNHPEVGPLFTDFTYDNLGIPKNPKNPFYTIDRALNPAGASYVDHGLRDTVKRASEDGKFRVPTLRNIARTAPYGHNGYFASLKDVVDFYNTRDVGRWPAAEIPATMNRDELGDLKLTNAEVEDVVSFLRTLTDK